MALISDILHTTVHKFSNAVTLEPCFRPNVYKKFTGLGIKYKSFIIMNVNKHTEII